jgi:hypothetical protein
MTSLNKYSFIRLSEAPFHGTSHDFDSFDVSKADPNNNTTQPLWGLNFTERNGVGNKIFSGQNGFVIEVEFTKPDRILVLNKPINQQSELIQQALNPIIDTLLNLPNLKTDQFSGSIIKQKQDLATRSIKAIKLIHLFNLNRDAINIPNLNTVNGFKREISMFLDSLGIYGASFLEYSDGDPIYTIWNTSIIKILSKKQV